MCAPQCSKTWVKSSSAPREGPAGLSRIQSLCRVFGVVGLERRPETGFDGVTVQPKHHPPPVRLCEDFYLRISCRNASEESPSCPRSMAIVKHHRRTKANFVVVCMMVNSAIPNNRRGFNKVDNGNR